MPCYRGQQLLDKSTLSSCCESLQQGTIFYAILSFQRSTQSCPACQWLPLWGNGDDRRQRRKQGGAVGAAASRMQATAKQTLGAATRPWRAKRLRGCTKDSLPVSRSRAGKARLCSIFLCPSLEYRRKPSKREKIGFPLAKQGKTRYSIVTV